MITHLIRSINWVDVALIILFVRMIFVGVKNGFISEFFKFLGVLTAVFFSFHYYSSLAAWMASKTNIFQDYWDCIMFAGIWLVVALFFRFLGASIVVLFKVETNHQGFDKYASGVVAVGRGVLVSSMIIFLLFLTHNAPLMLMTFRSCSYKIAGRAGVSTYGFLYNNLVSKFFVAEHYNTAPVEVLHQDSIRLNKQK